MSSSFIISCLQLNTVSLQPAWAPEARHNTVDNMFELIFDELIQPPHV